MIQETEPPAVRVLWGIRGLVCGQSPAGRARSSLLGHNVGVERPRGQFSTAEYPQCGAPAIVDDGETTPTATVTSINLHHRHRCCPTSGSLECSCTSQQSCFYFRQPAASGLAARVWTLCRVEPKPAASSARPQHGAQPLEAGHAWTWPVALAAWTTLNTTHAKKKALSYGDGACLQGAVASAAWSSAPPAAAAASSLLHRCRYRAVRPF